MKELICKIAEELDVDISTDEGMAKVQDEMERRAEAAAWVRDCQREDMATRD